TDAEEADAVEVGGERRFPDEDVDEPEHERVSGRESRPREDRALRRGSEENPCAVRDRSSERAVLDERDGREPAQRDRDPADEDGRDELGRDDSPPRKRPEREVAE